MSRTRAKTSPAVDTRVVRCAIYTRKSTEEGLDQDFNSLDAQREAGEAYVRSQAGEGWALVPDRYDDGGFTGGNTDRPALTRLMADVEAGRVDCVVVYKVDRLSRSLLDFARLMATFEQHQVSFVSVTQQFNTATSMGRLVLNVLLSFAQFEREIISERTRDKIAATRRKGKWAGGHPILGYDVDPDKLKLTVNDAEADRVRAIFALYRERGSLRPVLAELDRRGWANKQWVTRKGQPRGGGQFSKSSLHGLLTNVAYIGKVRYKDEVHPGEHRAIVEPGSWQAVQALLAHNRQAGGAAARNRFGAILKGLIRCAPCGCAMTPSHTTRPGGRRYRYYVCGKAQARGWHTCPSKAIPAGAVEALVVSRVKAVGRDPALRADVVAAVGRRHEERAADLRRERAGLEADLRNRHARLRAVTARVRPGAENAAALAELADLQRRIAAAEVRVGELAGEARAAATRPDDDAVVGALTEFAGAWDALSPREQARAIHLIVQRVDYDGTRGKIAVTFREDGIETLVAGMNSMMENLP